MERLLGAVYSGSSSYKPSTYTYTSSYIPTYYSGSTIIVSGGYNYYPTGYYYGAVYSYNTLYYNPVGRIVGSIIGSLVFILILSLLICWRARSCCFKNCG